MIFVGDIAIPHPGAVRIVGLPEGLFQKQWFGNLEGAVIADGESERKKSVVFNSSDGIVELLQEFDFAGFALANNHIFDTGNYKETTSFLNELGVPYVGIGENVSKASIPLILNDGDKEIVILNFGWEVIQCKLARDDRYGVNPLVKDHVLKSVKDALRSHPDAVVIPFMHWSYELESEPQPFERELAKEMIDLGVAGVIGCHPHRIGGLEVYKGKPIVYSLGNWMFKQKYYHNGRLKFPDFCNKELALEWDFASGELIFHFFEFNRVTSTLTFSHSEKSDSETMAELTPFRAFSDIEYKKWYKDNHFHKNKGLPIYYYDDSKLSVATKDWINRLRDSAIKIALKLKSLK